jgi:hypothetical protein
MESTTDFVWENGDFTGVCAAREALYSTEAFTGVENVRRVLRTMSDGG